MRKTATENASHAGPKGHQDLTAPSPWIERWHGDFDEGKTVLDLACGQGRHGRLFLDAGATVTFVDIDITGLDDLKDRKRAIVLQADLESDAWPLPGRTFDAVVVTNYLYRPIMRNIIDAVAPGGWLFYETFAVGNERYGRPSNPDFLLKHDELKHWVEGELDIVGYAHSMRVIPRRAVMQHIAARRPGHSV